MSYGPEGANADAFSVVCASNNITASLMIKPAARKSS
jgi:hypothetical protein